jgi:hypothetical protein
MSGVSSVRALGQLRLDLQRPITSSALQEQENKKHDVYDATSRSVELPLHTIPTSLIAAEEAQQYDESQSRVTRNDIDFAGKGCATSRGFVLKNFLSAAECEALVAATEGSSQSCFSASSAANAGLEKTKIL